MEAYGNIRLSWNGGGDSELFKYLRHTLYYMVISTLREREMDHYTDEGEECEAEILEYRECDL